MDIRQLDEKAEVMERLIVSLQLDLGNLKDKLIELREMVDNELAKVEEDEVF